MTSEKALDFLNRHGMSPDGIEPARDAKKMAAEMELGLAGHGGSLPMIPTYLSDGGEIPAGEPVAVIDAGGTNFRCGLVRFGEKGPVVEELRKWKMPGIGKPATWEAFMDFAAEAILPLMATVSTAVRCQH